MGSKSGIGPLLAVLGLAFLLMRPRRNGSIQPAGWHTQYIWNRFEGGDLPHVPLTYGMSMPKFPDYPQVTAKTRLDPRTDNYEEALEAKYPRLLRQTRVAHRKTRKVLGLRDYTPPPMPRSSRGGR